MIVLDTHVWIWWVHADPQLPAAMNQCIRDTPAIERRLSIISCWEVAKLIEVRRLVLPVNLSRWFERATHPTLLKSCP